MNERGHLKVAAMGLVGGYELLDYGAGDMADGDVGFLDALRIARGNVEKDVHFAGQRAAGFTGEGDEESTASASCFDCLDNIRAGAAGGEGYDYVVWADERFHLAGENTFETVIVASGGEHRSVCGEG